MHKIGDKVGRLTLIDKKRENKRTYFLCRCECGTEKWIRDDCLKNTVSCGCYNREKNLFKGNALQGKRFGRLTVIKKTVKRANNGSIIWLCKCDCGNYKEVSSRDLKDGFVSSCGCLGTERSQRNIQKAINKHLQKHIVDGTNLQVITRKTLIKSNKSGVTGVHWSKTRKMWVAQIEFKGHKYRLGRFKNKNEAIQARKEAEKKYFEAFLKEKDIQPE